MISVEAIKAAQEELHANATNSIFYETWVYMNKACYYPTNPKYKFFGAKGCFVADEWRRYEGNFDGLYNFIAWSLDPRNCFYPNQGLSLKMIDSSKGFTPDNCIWVTPIIRENTRNDNLFLNYAGKSMTLAEFCRYHNFENHYIAHNKLVKKWDLIDIATVPLDNYDKESYYNNVEPKPQHDIVMPLCYPYGDMNDPRNWYGNEYWLRLQVKAGIAPPLYPPVDIRECFSYVRIYNKK